MLRLCGFQEWTALRDALQTKPEKVLPTIRIHEKAQTVWLQAYHEVLDREEKIRRGYYGKQDARARTFSELVKSIND
jgi:DNA-directed RNA polymerase sigma subunit (sigma70/sigma32)